MQHHHLQHPHRQGMGPLDLEGKEIGAVLVANGEQIGQPPVDQQHHTGAHQPISAEGVISAEHISVRQ